jgi:TonB family protein
MNGASLPRSAFLSLLIHITLFVMTLWAAKHSNQFVMPSPYVVTLVSPGPEASVRESPRTEPVSPQPQAESTPERKMTYDSSKTARKKKEQPKEQVKEQYVEDRIAALKAKKDIERLGRLRAVVSPKVGKGESRLGSSVQRGTTGRGQRAEDYTTRIVGEIQQYWQLPQDLFRDKNMETIVSIRILKDGSLQVLGIEKSSGNPLFNREALRTIAKASPVTPPPQEMEIGVRFYP